MAGSGGGGDNDKEGRQDQSRRKKKRKKKPAVAGVPGVAARQEGADAADTANRGDVVVTDTLSDDSGGYGDGADGGGNGGGAGAVPRKAKKSKKKGKKKRKREIRNKGKQETSRHVLFAAAPTMYEPPLSRSSSDGSNSSHGGGDDDDNGHDDGDDDGDGDDDADDDDADLAAAAALGLEDADMNDPKFAFLKTVSPLFNREGDWYGKTLEPIQNTAVYGRDREATVRPSVLALRFTEAEVAAADAQLALVEAQQDAAVRESVDGGSRRSSFGSATGAWAAAATSLGDGSLAAVASAQADADAEAGVVRRRLSAIYNFAPPADGINLARLADFDGGDGADVSAAAAAAANAQTLMDISKHISVQRDTMSRQNSLRMRRLSVAELALETRDREQTLAEMAELLRATEGGLDSDDDESDDGGGGGGEGDGPIHGPAEGADKAVRKFGMWDGVFARCLLNFFGVIMFLRLGWIVAEAGALLATAIVLMSVLVTTITTLSLSAVASNGLVAGGGVYFMISRNLGPEIGGAIGLLFSFANAAAVALHLVGFAETVVELEWLDITDDALMDVRIISLVACAALLTIAIVSVSWVVKTQLFLLAFIIASIIAYMLGTFVKTNDTADDGHAGYGIDNMADNLQPSFSRDESFLNVLAVFFPAVTGVMAGANISGNLKRPAHDIPRGTLLAVAVSTAVYIVLLWMLGFTTERNALTDPLIMVKVAGVTGPLIILGIFAATLSGALASLASAPRVFQAIASDKILPYIGFWGKGYGSTREPRRAYMLSFGIAAGFIMIGELNAIALVITEIFLLSYLLVNFACAHATFSAAPSWRPSFRYYNKWLALLGCLLCFGGMMLINVWTSLTSIVICIGIYKWIEFEAPEVNWGSALQARKYVLALQEVLQLQDAAEHVKTYRPQYLVLTGPPLSRRKLIAFTSHLYKGRGIVVYGHIVQGEYGEAHVKVEYEESLRRIKYLNKAQLGAFLNVTTAPTLRGGAQQLMQLSGLGRMAPNTLVVGYKHGWYGGGANMPAVELEEYVGTLGDAFDMHMAVVLVRHMSDEALNQRAAQRLPIDTYWLVDDGGFTVLIPHILRQGKYWRHSRQRVFVRGNNEADISAEQLRMTKMLREFRIDADVEIVMSGSYRSKAVQAEVAHMLADTYDTPVPADRRLFRRTCAYYTLGRQIAKLSGESGLIVVTLPMPSSAVPARLYMVWLELLSVCADVPTVFIRGNQQSVLTRHG